MTAEFGVAVKYEDLHRLACEVADEIADALASEGLVGMRLPGRYEVWDRQNEGGHHVLGRDVPFDERYQDEDDDFKVVAFNAPEDLSCHANRRDIQNFLSDVQAGWVQQVARWVDEHDRECADALQAARRERGAAA